MTSFFTLLISVLIFSLATTTQASDMGGFNVAANKILAGPTAGGNGTATYRSLVAADIPALPYGTGTVTSTSVATANGFSGTVATATTTPAITIIASGCNGICKSNATAISTATSGTDYSAGTSGLATGILKSTTATGALTIAVAGDFPTLNQNTTGTASNVSGTPALPNGTTATTQAALDNSTKLGTTAYTDAAVAAGKGLVEAIGGHVVAPDNYTYALDEYAMYAYTINAIAVKTTAGTITAAIKINGTNVTSCNGLAVTSAQSLTTCTAANTVAVGDRVTLVTSANAASADLTFTVKVTR